MFQMWTLRVKFALPSREVLQARVDAMMESDAAARAAKKKKRKEGEDDGAKEKAPKKRKEEKASGSAGSSDKGPGLCQTYTVISEGSSWF